MGQKTTTKLKVSKQAKRELNVRQAQVLTYLALGKRVREIARELGVSDDSIRRDIRRLEETKTYDNRLKIELEKHCLLWNKALACVEANLDNGNLKAAEDVLKYTGIWIDRLDIVAKVAPDEQQKKMIENMETLLKLSKDRVRGALPEKTTTKEVGVVCNHPSDISGPNGCPECAKILKKMEAETQPQLGESMTKETEVDVTDCVRTDCVSWPNCDHTQASCKGLRTKETETQSQLKGEALEVAEYEERERKKDYGELAKTDPCGPKKPEGCICVGDRHNPLNIDPQCPIHGDKDKDQGGGHPPPGGC